jgi:hypothetical protein
MLSSYAIEPTGSMRRFGDGTALVSVPHRREMTRMYRPCGTIGLAEMRMRFNRPGTITPFP